MTQSNATSKVRAQEERYTLDSQATGSARRYARSIGNNRDDAMCTLSKATMYRQLMA